MNAPKSYSANLQNRIITPTMLADCLYSMDQRLLNCSEKEKFYHDLIAKGSRDSQAYTYPIREEQYRENWGKYYLMREELLSFLKPVCVYRHQQEPGWTGPMQGRASSFDERMGYRYYLGYEVDGRSFRMIPQNDLVRYADLPVTHIERLNSQRCGLKELVSVKFVRKVLALLETGIHPYPASDPQEKIA